MSEHSTGLQGGFSPLALIYYGETNMKKKDIIELQCYKQTKINPRWKTKSKFEQVF